MTVPRAANPLTNPNGYMAAVGAILAAAVMLYNAFTHHGVIDTTVIVAGAGAFLSLVSRNYVTPVKDPRDGNGSPLAVVTPQLAEVLRKAAALPPPVPGLTDTGGPPAPPPAPSAGS